MSHLSEMFPCEMQDIFIFNAGVTNAMMTYEVAALEAMVLS